MSVSEQFAPSVLSSTWAIAETVNVIGDNNLYLKIFLGGFAIIFSGFLGALVLGGTMSPEKLNKVRGVNPICRHRTACM